MTNQRITIEKLSFGGSGVGRIDGKVCFVPYSAPGDDLLVRIAGEKRSYINAEIVEIISPSQSRVTPPCPLFGRCGGCNWQHISYPAQLEAKQKIVAETLWRGARVSDDRIAEAVAAPAPFGYRSRVQFKLFASPDKLNIGFYRQGSHYVEDAAEGCPIALPIINESLRCLRSLLSSFAERNKIPQINIDCGEQGCVAIINYIGSDNERLISYIKSGADVLGPITGVFLQTGRKSTLQKIWGSELLSYRLPAGNEGSDYEMRFRPGGFSQVNQRQNVAILELVRSFGGFNTDQRILDLYCGNGNFSLPISSDVASVTGLEEYADSIAAAVDNSHLNNVINAGYIASDAASGLRRLISKAEHFDVCILDPPRSGAADLLKDIALLSPEKVIYISCDPNTMARDCNTLAGLGYGITRTVPVDMFPQTYHIETVTLLQRI